MERVQIAFSASSVLLTLCFRRQYFSLVINPTFLLKLPQADFCNLKSSGLTNILGVRRCHLNKSKYNGPIVTTVIVGNIAGSSYKIKGSYMPKLDVS